jgi:ABC-type uncharacterized transport system fused permease/ATPase subunit
MHTDAECLLGSFTLRMHAVSQSVSQVCSYSLLLLTPQLLAHLHTATATDKTARTQQRHQRLSSFRRTSKVSAVFLTFSDVTVSLPAKTKGGAGKVLIDSITAHAVSGRVLALMGPSGMQL